MTQPLDDLALLDRWANHADREAGQLLVARYYETISRWFRRQVSDPNDRENLTQDTFARLAAGAYNNFEGRSSFRAFLFGIARNVLQDHLRKRYRSPTFDPAVTSFEEFGDLAPPLSEFEFERTIALVQSLRVLPIETKQLLEDYYWHDLTATELGEILGIREATVRTRLHQARLMLRAAVAQRQPTAADVDVEEHLLMLRHLFEGGPRHMEQPDEDVRYSFSIESEPWIAEAPTVAYQAGSEQAELLDAMQDFLHGEMAERDPLQALIVRSRIDARRLEEFTDFVDAETSTAEPLEETSTPHG